MMFLMSQKYFKKKAEKLVAPNNYFIIDGTNYGVTGDDIEGLHRRYNNCHVMGGWCPEGELYRLLRKKKSGEDFSEKKFDKYLKEFLHDEDFVGAVCATTKAQASYGVDQDMNIFIVIPNLVYKYLAKQIKKRVYKIVLRDKADIPFFMTQDDLEKTGKAALSTPLTKSQLKTILERVKKAEKRHKINYNTEDDD